MSNKVKRRMSSLSYSINKFYRKISTVRPSTIVLSVVAMAVAIFLFGGGIYNVVTRPLPSAYVDLPGGGRFIFLYPQLSEQFVTDSIVVMILYSLGIIGAIAMYQSTKYAYKPRQAYLMFLVGVIFLVLAYILLENALQIKMG
ncbi:hypothetical protein KAU92_02080 [Candidatus Bathyarchaeota archaeon]|nr:hypothetical protein [Candidatus Bathyarchaeota archaeon]MCK4669277.1 hypothetical protein [Candidatus Bathyarchaeota archaeon]